MPDSPESWRDMVTVLQLWAEAEIGSPASKGKAQIRTGTTLALGILTLLLIKISLLGNLFLLRLRGTCRPSVVLR
jgi:hypothetical protein